MNRCDVIDLLEDRYGINKDNLTKRELAIIGICTVNYTKKDEAELNLHLVSKRELINDVKETLYKYKEYVLADDKLNLEEKQLECYRVQPLIRNLNVC